MSDEIEIVVDATVNGINHRKVVTYPRPAAELKARHDAVAAERLLNKIGMPAKISTELAR